MSPPVQGRLGLWESTGSNCFALAALNPLQLLATHPLPSSGELRGPQDYPGLSPWISSLSLACSQAHAAAPFAHVEPPAPLTG